MQCLPPTTRYAEPVLVPRHHHLLLLNTDTDFRCPYDHPLTYQPDSSVHTSVAMKSVAVVRSLTLFLIVLIEKSYGKFCPYIRFLVLVFLSLVSSVISRVIAQTTIILIYANDCVL